MIQLTRAATVYIRRHSHRQRAVGIVAAQADFKSFDVALGAAHVPLGCIIGIHAPIKNRSCSRRPGRQPHLQFIAEANAVNVSFLDVCAHPKIVLD